MRGPSFTRQEKKRRLGRGLGSLISSPVEVKVPAQPTPVASPSEADGTHAPSPAAPSFARPPVFHVEHPLIASAIRRDEEALQDSPAGDAIVELPLEFIDANPFQPRRQFDPAGLAALADSIRSAGVMQPILVRPARSASPNVPRGTFEEAISGSGLVAQGLRYELIAGERRLRAAKLIPLATIPAVIRDIDDRAAAEWALIENVQREDLNPIERAEAFQTLIDHFSLTHAEISERVGLERSSISNILRLNDLDETTKDAVRAGKLSPGHGKALLAVGDLELRRTLTTNALQEEWSVRELERRIQDVLAHHAGLSEQTLTERADAGAKGNGADSTKAGGRDQAAAAAKTYLGNLEKVLGEQLGTRVHLRAGSKKGTGAIIIEFFSLDQFDGLMAKMGIDPEKL
jgi:ParB family chromosome partitioning protein